MLIFYNVFKFKILKLFQIFEFQNARNIWDLNLFSMLIWEYQIMKTTSPFSGHSTKAVQETITGGIMKEVVFKQILRVLMIC